MADWVFICIEPPEAYPSKELLISSGVGKMTLNSGFGAFAVADNDSESKRVRLIQASVAPNVAMDDICTTTSDFPD